MDGKLKKLEEIDQFFKEKEFIKEKWIRTGISGFDNLIKNGIPEGSNIIIAGGPGCGKTIFCLQTLYNLACQGHDCVYLSMEERPERLKSHMLSFGFDVKEIKNEPNQIILSAKNCGKIALKRLQPIIIARSVEALLEKASGRLPLDIDVVLDFIPENFNPRLLALDSISAIETSFSGKLEQYRIYIEQLFRFFEELALTTFFITESSDAPYKFSRTGVEDFLADGIIVFYNFQGETERLRGVEIIKLRGTSHSQRIAPITISSEGINVFSGSFFNLKSKIQQPTIENSVKEIETQKQISYSSDNEEDILKKLIRKKID
ncbi:MAG: AAA family ATPase [Thermoplasmata archaeon]|nr:AAA family ATPase [Thermoplasmata archaeon]MBE3137385.1 AAA family ATPase [Thermoplasmata archaeon]MBE3140944.1 AAA family ATPase [Thermoplasmata archaeon]